MTSDHSVKLEDYLAWEELAFSWARAMDTKDWAWLRSIMAPRITLDYSEVFGYKDDNLTPDAFVGTFQSPDMLGNRNVKTQHLLVASKVESLSSTTAMVTRQIKALHVLYDSETKKETARSTGHGVLQFSYGKVDGDWKISGLKASNDFFDTDMRSVFTTFPEIELKL